MKKEFGKVSLWKRFSALTVAAAILLGMLPYTNTASAAADGTGITTVADPQTLIRPGTIYGDSTVNAGKITVGKSVSNSGITVNGQSIALNEKNNFLITISQSAQVMGLASEGSVPVDVVFVLDTSGSMDDNDRAETMVKAANSSIATLMEANEHNRVAVVAFSSEDYGEGTGSGAAASVLSSLAHYTGDAATNHLQWVNNQGGSTGSDRVYIAGRDNATLTVTTGNGFNQQTQTLNVNAFRHGKSGGTNIQAGIAAGAKILTTVTNTTYTDPQTKENVTRIPFLIILSDGQPTFSYDDEVWYDPTLTGQNAAREQGPGSDAYEGNGFLAAMTAAYYKGRITEHYYGSKANGENRCFVYTVGVELGTLSGDELALAQITLDPRSRTTGDHAAANAESYWNYGNTANNNTRDSFYGWKTYWNNYLADPAGDFTVRVDGDGDGLWLWSGNGSAEAYYEVERPREPGRRATQEQWNAYYAALREYEAWRQWREANFTYYEGEYYTFTAQSIADSKKYVNGVGYNGGIAYNDGYFGADSVSQMESIFEALVRTIQQKAITSPTKVSTGDHDFDGYVTFTDPIGEYMEVKDMKGIVAGGYFYQGASFAQKLANFHTANADAEFDDLLLKVVQSRMNLTSSVVDIDAFVAKVKASRNQAYYNGPDDYDNSIVWWGNSYDSGEEDEQVQVMGFADNDSIAYIEAQKAAGTIPAGADYVCRSYFFYGEAGGANPDPDHTYLYFMVRVQRELTAPYRETVVISAPASLLSMEKVLITETFDGDGNPSYTASVEHQEPARVIYEVGLWDTITPENVYSIVSADYANETVNGAGSFNYNADTNTYHFFTNDWDRTETLGSHHRAMAKATFDAAADNGFYTYQEDTLILDANGAPVTADPAGTDAYYARTYYEWFADNGADGTYTAAKKTALIEVDIPADAQLTEKDGKWYIPAGTYTAATLVVNGDDTVKTNNATGTSSVVAHPHRTGDSGNSHYTVFLGNNGMLSLQAETYVPEKSVSVNLAGNAVNIVDEEGKPVRVGDVLTYTVEVRNILAQAADITVSDYVPLGTAFIEGSAGWGTAETGHTKDVSIQPDSNNVLTWTLQDVPAGQTRYVSFQVTVTEAAMSLNVVPGTIDNTAQVRFDNGPTFSSNTTHNPPYDKTVTDVNNQNIHGQHGFKVGDVLVYHIRFHNNAVDANGNHIAADVTVTDKIPEGTTFLSADNGGSYDAASGEVVWSFEDVQPNTAMVVSFRVAINASAKVDSAAAVQPETGEIYLPNTATIAVGNDPKVMITNTTENWADVGDMVLSKLVAEGGDRTKRFTIHLTESTGLLAGTYVLERGTAAERVVFDGGKASVTIGHGEVLTIKGLPAGIIISAEEDVSALPGWTPSYNTQSVTIVKGAATAISSVSVTNTYTRQPVTVTLKGVKEMGGFSLTKDATFGFVAVPDSGNPVVGDPLTGEVTVRVPGKYEFTMSPMVFTKPGVYRYTISEINGNIQGVLYDNATYVLVVQVTDNGDGTMSASATLDGSAFDLTADALSFSNTYIPKDTQLVLTADKALSGRTLIPGEFAFQITDGTNTYKGVHDADGNIVFAAIHYTAAGTYTYTMSEVVPDTKAEGVTYDPKTYTVEVVVSDVNGQLVSSVSVDGVPKTAVEGVADTGITFVNTFEPEDVPLTLVANKTLKVYDPATGTYVNAAPEAGKFRFQIVEKGTDQVITTGANAADGSITFHTFYFSADMLAEVEADGNGTKTKTFTYVVSEVVPELAKDPNMRYDLDGREIEAVLTYAADGTLTVSVGGDSDGTVDLTGSVDFVNYGNPDSVAVQPEGTKTTENAPAGISFSFSVINTETGNEAAVGIGDANGSIRFSTMSFEKTGTYTYWIKESNAGNTTNGITYDVARYLMKVEVSRDNYNRLVAEVSYWASNVDGSENVADYTVSAGAPSFHNKYEAGGYINLTATKKMEGRDLNAGEFAFKLIRQDNGGEIDGIVAADGTITFSTMYYSQADIAAGETSAVIRYVMSEVIPTAAALPGVTYDTAQYDVFVRITDNGNGVISAELVAPDGNGGYTPISGTDTGVTFTNTYKAVHGDRVKLRIAKTLNGRSLRDGEFDFLLYQDGRLEDIASNDAEGFVTFSREIPATAVPGTYELTITEAQGNLSGVTYDTASYKVYLKITDDGKGNISAELVDAAGTPLAQDSDGVVDLTGQITFVNTYKPSGTGYTPAVSKELTGRHLISGEFTFQAEDLASGTVYNGINTASGAVVFDTIHYTKSGTYTYQISEVQPAADPISGMTYDTAVYYLKVVVADNENGQLVVESADYYSDPAFADKADAVVFKNTYVPSDVRIELEATKELIGRPLNDKEFSFVVRQDDVNGKVVAVGSNNAAGEILFSTFDITAADMGGQLSKTFTYVVTESDNNIPGVAVDKTVFTVTVTVTDDGSGALQAQIHYPGNGGIVFHNSYKPAPVKLPLVAYKALTGKNLKAGEFTFILKDAAGETVRTGTNDINGVISFADLTFDQAGTYVYTLTEKDDGAEGMEYDSNVYTITVTVTDDLKGNLVAAASYADKEGAVELIRFANSYTPSEIRVELDGTKSIVDPSGNPLNNDRSGFEFEVRDMEGKLVTTAVSDTQGNIKFTGFAFTAAGEYRFLIIEKATAKGGYTIDPTVWCVHITIGYDADAGALYEAGEYIHLAPENHEQILAQSSAELSFVNVYEPADVSLTVKVKKELTGRDLRDHEFAFCMVDKATGLFAAQSRNHANGEVIFHLNYSETGTYQYVIREEIPADENKLPGVEYSGESYALTVTVTDDGTGALKATAAGIPVTGSGTLNLTGSLIFHNSYTPEPVDVTIEAHKRLEGRGLTAGIFSFELVNVNDPDDKRTATNGADGKIAFEKITYTEAGVYEYTLSEVIGSAGGVTYDTNTYKVTVNVTDDGNGNLFADVLYASGEENTEADPVFYNTYKAEKVGIQVKADKTLVNKDMAGGEFTFELKDSSGNTVQATNDADGKIVFDTIEYTQAGVYAYTLYEIAGTDENVTYDDTVYTVTVTVTDDLEGHLDAEVDFGGKAPVFENIYTPDPVAVTLEGTKNLTGRDMTAGEFAFEVRDVDGNLFTTGTNVADGKIVFDAVDVEAEMDQIFFITEVKGTDRYIKYDKSIYRVQVTVTNENGVLTADVSYLDGQVEFNNEFDDDVPPPTGDTAPVFAYMGMMALSLLAACAMLLLRRREKKEAC